MATDTRIISENRLTQYFTYLDALRETGVTNMYFASPYIRDEFKTSDEVAERVLTLWMQTFGDEAPEERAKLAWSRQEQTP